MKCSDDSWRAAQVQKEYGIELQPWQIEILQNWKEGNLLVKAARRTGKNALCALLATELARAGLGVVIACPNRRMAEPIQELLDRIGGSDRITVTDRVKRGARADIGIANDAAWMTSFQLDDLEKAGGRTMLISSWPPDPDSTRFGWLWRYGGLKWQRLEVPADLDGARGQAEGLTDEVICNELLRSPGELRRKRTC